MEGYTLKWFLSYIKPCKVRIAVELVIKTIATSMDLCIPWILAHIIDVVIPSENTSFIALWGALMIFCSVVCVVGNVTANRLASSVARDTTMRVRHDLFAKIMSLSSERTDAFTVPSLVSRITTDTYNLNSMTGMLLRLGIRAPILLFGGIVITLSMDVPLALVWIAVLPLAIGVFIIVSMKGIPLFVHLQKSIDKMVQVIRENISGVRVIKALSKTEYEMNRFSKINEEVSRNEERANIAMGLTNPIINMLLNIALSIVIFIGAYRVSGNATGLGTIVAFTSYFAVILNAVMGITRIFVIVSRAAASAKRISEVLYDQKDLEKINTNDKCNDFIRLNDVCFSYNKHKNNLSNISFSLNKGGSLGIIGATGSGKTTLINILMRFYDADSGSVFIDGKDIRSYENDILRKKFGVVFQNDILFADSVRNNVDFGRGLPEENIISALENAQAYEFVEGLRNGIDTVLNPKGNDLSGGQKQRLLIARALATRPEIIVLDDSSSALDYKTDAALRAALRKNYGDSTIIIIAQRISSVKDLDNIIFLDNGEIEGMGTHEELMKNCSSYKETAKLQMGE
ncbi:MAG: ABC transporter ATP-binding protein [Oscillospiraceae bacterium]|nr:ABC transporter ATP-binding protein [Oscillospiraceae bacterium]